MNFQMRQSGFRVEQRRLRFFEPPVQKAQASATMVISLADSGQK
jgi:hypothetical protein